MVQIRIAALALIAGLIAGLLAFSPSSGRAQGPAPSRANGRADGPGTSLFAQSASQALQRDFPSDDISFLLLDAQTGTVFASRWDHPETSIPLGSLVKPFVALAYGELHEFEYPAHICRGTSSGCWLPRGHGAVGLTSAIAYSCNSYFRVLTANMTAAEIAPTATSFGLQLPAPGISGPVLAGLSDHDLENHGLENHGLDKQWLISPLSMARAYLELIRRRDQPGVRLILGGMEQSARQGTGAEVDRALGISGALAKTGTAPCTHARRAPGDGFTVALAPGRAAAGSAFGPRSRRSGSASRQDRRTNAAPHRAMSRRLPIKVRMRVRMKARMRMLVKIAMAFGAPIFSGALAFTEDVRVHDVLTHDVRIEDVRIGVLGLFHPREFTVSAVEGNAIAVHAGQETFVLEKSSGVGVAEIRVVENMMAVRVGTRVVHISELTVTGRASGATDFLLAIPGKITRRYRGTLELKPVSGALVAVVRMGLETAVASVVAAEILPGAPLEALKAQAIAARSYFAAGKGRHSGFDFCDTTHCQFLREPPGPGSAAEAASATRGLVMVYRSHPFAAMYTRSCSGRTRTPADVGLAPGNYPYYSVVCKYCREHPSRWQSRISARDAATLRSSDEASRLKIDRRLGWSTALSNNFAMRKEGGHVILEGTGQGHGIGLCQSGATAMAEEGANFQQILSHYYPNAAIVSLSLELAAAVR